MVSRRKVISSPHRPPISPLTRLPPTFRLAAQSSAIPQPFLKCRAPPLAAAIVTNPPFKHAEAMLRHPVAIGIEYLVFLHKAQWPNTVERRRLFGEVWCPVRSYHLEWRPDFTGQGAPTMDCNWRVFGRRSMKEKSWTSSVLQKPAMALCAIG